MPAGLAWLGTRVQTQTQTQRSGIYLRWWLVAAKLSSTQRVSGVDVHVQRAREAVGCAVVGAALATSGHSATDVSAEVWAERTLSPSQRSLVQHGRSCELPVGMYTKPPPAVITFSRYKALKLLERTHAPSSARSAPPHDHAS